MSNNEEKNRLHDRELAGSETLSETTKDIDGKHPSPLDGILHLDKLSEDSSEADSSGEDSVEYEGYGDDSFAVQLIGEETSPRQKYYLEPILQLQRRKSFLMAI